MKPLVERIRDKVAVLGVNLAAEVFGTSPNHLRKWVSGAATPPWRIAEQLVAEEDFVNTVLGPTEEVAADPKLPVIEWTPDASIAVAMLGRYGDIISILPACRYIYENYGKPSLVC